MKTILLNGIQFTYKEIEPTELITGRDKFYIFEGIAWKELQEEPQFKYLYQIDETFICLANPKDPKAFFFYNNQWYKKA